MSEERDRLDCLIENAKLLVDYNTNTGILPSSRIEEALAAVLALEKRGKLTFDSSAASVLRGEVARLVTVIKPATLQDIRKFPPYTSNQIKKNKINNLYNAMYIVFGLFLILNCAYFTDWAKRAQTLMDDVKEVQKTLASERFKEINDRWSRVSFDIPSADAISQSDVERGFGTIAVHFETFQSIGIRAEELKNSYLPVWLGFLRPVSDDEKSLSARNVSTETQAPIMVRGGLPSGNIYSESNQSGVVTARSPQSYSFSPQESKSCFVNYLNVAMKLKYFKNANGLIENASMPIHDVFSDWASEQVYNAHLDLMACTYKLETTLASRLKEALSDQYYSGIVRSVRNKIDLLSTWILPSLYGMLGAGLMSLQLYQDRLRPSQGHGKVLSRVLMGGFIGLVVGWIWSPQSSEFFEFANINVGLFSVAFLFGYGSDVFLGLLERIVQALGSIAGQARA